MSRSNRSTWLITRQLAETPRRRIARVLRRYWRPVTWPTLRELVCAIAIYLTIGALGWSLLTGDPRAALIAGIGLLLLSKLVDRTTPPTRKEPTR